MLEIQAGSIASVQVSFFDTKGVPIIPGTATFKVLGKVEGGTWQTIRGPVTISPLATVVTIALLTTDTVLLGAGPKERRRVCVFIDSIIYQSYDFNVIAQSSCS